MRILPALAITSLLLTALPALAQTQSCEASADLTFKSAAEKPASKQSEKAQRLAAMARKLCEAGNDFAARKKMQEALALVGVDPATVLAQR